MAKEKTLVEDTFIQMKNLEEAVAENAKGILASTMKQEIKDLVKESLFEQEEEEDEIEDTEVEPTDDVEDTDNLEDEDEFSMEEPMDDEQEPIDLTDPSVSNDEVLKVFQLMGPDDEVIVVKDGDGNINLKDNQTSKEYMIVQESDDDFAMEDYDMGEFGENDSEFYESDDAFPGFDSLDEDFEEEDYGGVVEDYPAIDDIFARAFKKETHESYEDSEYADLEEDFIYEVEMDEEDSDVADNGYPDDTLGDDGIGGIGGLEEDLYESKSIKPKGKGMGSPNKFKYSSKPNQEGGFKTVKKSPNKTMGTGKAKFTYKDGENLDGEFKIKPKSIKRGGETSEASRTLGAGRRFGKNGLDKPKAAPRHLRTESTEVELELLREKNNEYRNALNVFRDKLNEVAVFNSNLAYATRLFTEHTTTKQEKINILKRFDTVETIKESKNLYQSIKQELNKDNSSKPINESIERKIDNSPSTGSAINLIESKTYENPQFLRMKDLMSKIK